MCVNFRNTNAVQYNKPIDMKNSVSQILKQSYPQKVETTSITPLHGLQGLDVSKLQLASNIKAHDSEPSILSFESTKPSYDLNAHKNDFIVSQGNGLISHASDCGPSCATMVLKRFGIFDKNTTGAEGTKKVRGFLKQKDDPIDESQVERSIEHLSEGAVQKTSSSDFSNPSNLINYAKDQLSNGSMPILLTGSPYHDSDPNYDGRHYMVITGIEPNGNIQLADPGGKFSEMSADRLAHLMNKTDRGTSVLAFNKVN